MITKFEILKILEKKSHNIFVIKSHKIEDLFDYVNDDNEINFLDSDNCSILYHSLYNYNRNDKILDFLELLKKKKFDFSIDDEMFLFDLINNINIQSSNIDLFLFLINNLNATKYYLFQFMNAVYFKNNPFFKNTINNKKSATIIFNNLLKINLFNEKDFYLRINQSSNVSLGYNLIEIIYDYDKKLLNNIASKLTNYGVIELIEDSKISNFYKKQLEIKKFKI